MTSAFSLVSRPALSDRARTVICELMNFVVFCDELEITSRPIGFEIGGVVNNDLQNCCHLAR